MGAWRGFRDALRDDPQGVEDVLSVADVLGIPRPELAHVIEIESRWDPRARNPTSRATGLLQWIPSTARSMATTVDELRRMSRSQQASYVMAYMRRVPYRATGDAYLAVAAPSGIGKPDGHVLYPVGSDGWRDNPSWREPGGGDVTAGRIRRLGTPPPGPLPGAAAGPVKGLAKSPSGLAWLILALTWSLSRRR